MMTITCDNGYHDRDNGVCVHCVRDRIKQAVAEERERCVNIAEVSKIIGHAEVIRQIRVGEPNDKPKEDTCILCKKIFMCSFKDLKDAWCEECEVYVCNLCRAAHNMNAHLEKGTQGGA